VDIRPKLTWQDRVRITARVHSGHLAEDPKWTLRETAQELGRSVGRISEDLLLNSWLKTDPRVDRFVKVEEALDYVRKRKHEQRIRE
jgi:hypothetical protein